MSQQATPVSPAEAQAFLSREIFVPVFVEKLANDFGISPQNEDDLRELLSMGAKLTEAHEAELLKQADARTSFFKQANSALDREMVTQGYRGTTNEEALIKQASANMAARPEVAAAVNAWQTELARQLQAV